MVNAIKLEMHKHQPEASLSNNFAVALSEAQTAYANEIFKDSYCMGNLTDKGVMATATFRFKLNPGFFR